MKFLVDECVSPKLVLMARDRGFVESTHVTWLGLRSKPDWIIVRCARNEGYTLVTNNTADFTRLIGREREHSGLVCLNVAHGLMNLECQLCLFDHALRQMPSDGLSNTVLEVTLSGDGAVQADRYHLSAR